MSGSTAILLLASGLSSRMQGRDKLLEEVDGRPVLAHIAGEALASGAKTYVILPMNGFEGRRDCLEGLDIERLFTETPERGMGDTIATAMNKIAANAHDWILICPADMPEMNRDVIKAVLEACAISTQKIVRAHDSKGRAGHPVAFHNSLFAELRNLTGDEGAKVVIQASGHTPDVIDTKGRGATLDLDTPDAWRNWRAARG